MSALIPNARASREAAERAIDELWAEPEAEAA